MATFHLQAQIRANSHRRTPVTNLGELYGETLKVAAVFLDMNLNVAVALPKHL
jgi:hypothetical protein